MYSFCTESLSVFHLSTYRRAELKELADKISSAHGAHQACLESNELEKYSNGCFEYGVSVRNIKGATLNSKCERLKSTDFWVQQLDKVSSRAREIIAVRNLLIGPAQPFCSDETYEWYVARQAARGTNNHRSHKTGLERAANQVYLMAKAAARKAFERNLTSVFMTLGLDGRFHSSSSLYQGKTFEDGYAVLSKIFKSTLEHLSQYAVRGQDFFGVRCVEVHADGCPHLHVALYIRPDLLPRLKNKLRAIHYQCSTEMGFHFDKYQDKAFQVRSRGSLESYSKSIAYIFKNAYSGRARDRRCLIGALRQRAAISVFGKHQYELVGLNGKSSIIKEISKRRKVRQVENELGLNSKCEDRRTAWLKAISTLVFGRSSKYRLVKENRVNRYGEIVRKTVDVVTDAMSSWDSTNYSLILLAVICNNSRERSWLRKRAGDYSSIDQISCQTIRAPPSLCCLGWI